LPFNWSRATYELRSYITFFVPMTLVGWPWHELTYCEDVPAY